MRRLFVLVVLTAAACGSEPPVLPDAGVGPEPFIPFAVGNSWTYQLTIPGEPLDMKVQTVTGTASVEGETGFRIESVRAGDRVTRSVQMNDDGRLLRVEEVESRAGAVIARFVYEPFGLRVDSNKTTSGDEYTDAHAKIEVDASGAEILRDNKVHEFFVEAEKEIIDVPAGSFECVRVRRVRVDPPSEKTYWFAPGVGKIKEVGGQTEELVSVELAD